MAQRKKKSTKQRKTTKKKVERQLTRTIANSLLRLLKRFIVSLAGLMRKNPLVSLGFGLFLGFFCFVAYHASFNQSIVTRSFFFQNSDKAHDNSARNLTVEDLLRDNSSTITHQQAVIDNSAVHGRVAPAVAVNPVIENNDNNTPTIAINQKPFLSVIPQVKPKAPTATNNLPTSILSKEKAQIMQVQTALRSFGNNDLIVNGVPDSATSQAILAFQKMFVLKQTGIIDKELLTKMREVGLIQNDTYGLY